MEVLLSEQFEAAYRKLSKTDRRAVQKALGLLGDNPRHLGLRVKKMEGRKDTWEARASRRLRVTFEMAGGTIIMRNVGEHDRALRAP